MATNRNILIAERMNSVGLIGLFSIILIIVDK